MGITADLKSLKKYMRHRLAEWKVPGLAVGIVRGSDIVYRDVYGRRDVERGQRVGVSTRFGIASVTKAFTATAAAILVDEGKLVLDAPVQQYLKGFRLKDPVVAERVTVRDLLCHRTGVPEYPLAWYRSGLSRPELVNRLRHLELTADLRQKFQYQNLMYTAVGTLIEKLGGMPFEQFVQRRIFDPLGMADTAFYTRAISRDAGVARGYRLVNGRFQPVPYYDDSPTSPAGGVYSSITDMCKWAAMNLNGGVYGGERIVSEASLKDCHSPHMAIPVIPDMPEMLPMSYGMGWWVTGYRGHLRLWHSGGIDGFCARIELLPRDKIGVVLLSNLDAFPLPNAYLLNYVIAMRTYDTLLGLPPIDCSQRMREAASRAAAKRAPSRRQPRVSDEVLRRFVGLYHHPGHGTMEVTSNGCGLIVRMSGLQSKLHQKADAVFEGRILCWDVSLSFIKNGSRFSRVEMRFGNDGQQVDFARKRGGQKLKS